MVLLTPPQYARLHAQGYRMETDDLLTLMVRHPDTIPGYPCYRTVEETHAAMQGLATAHPAKFAGAIRDAIGRDVARHPAIDGLRELPTRCETLPAGVAEVQESIRRRVPAARAGDA